MTSFRETKLNAMSHTEYLCQKLIYDILWSIYFCKNKVIRITV
jgi:hypothetical protein